MPTKTIKSTIKWFAVTKRFAVFYLYDLIFGGNIHCKVNVKLYVMNSLNLDAPVKVFISDLTHFTKLNSCWMYSFHGNDVHMNVNKIHIQGEICKTSGFNNEILIIDDGTGKAKVVKGSQVPGDLSWISPGMYCSVVGALMENGKLPQVLAHKMAKINNEILKEMWSWEVKELRNLMLKKAHPRLPEHCPMEE